MVNIYFKGLECIAGFLSLPFYSPADGWLELYLLKEITLLICEGNRGH